MSADTAHPVSRQIEMLDVAAANEHSPAVPAIEGVTWNVCAGEFWVIGGLQDSGKSVLLTAAAGINRPLRGTLRLFGADLADIEEHDAFHRLLRIGLVFEGDGRLFTRMTVAENVALPLLYHANNGGAGTDARVKEILEATGLAHVADTLAARLPRNLRQRVGLARALALGPEVLLVDNPLSRLPLRDAHWWLGFLRQLADGAAIASHKPVTVVVTADELKPWCDCARQFAFLEKGQFRVVGGRTELTNCTEPAIRELLTDSGVTA